MFWGEVMLFNSWEFVFIFLPITLVVYFTLTRCRQTKLATASLVAASLVFYSYWDIRYLPLLLGSILFNYTTGSFIEKNRDKYLLGFAIATNLLLLGYFKYTGFFIQSLNDIVGASVFVPKIILPLGISFFTFTQTAYLVDAYRGETQKYSLLTYSLFVTVFPHLIAGPILYHKDMIPQFSKHENYFFSAKNMAIGVSMFAIGLFKKVMIADTLAPWVKAVFDNADKVAFLDAWAGALGYTLQLYFDFSGYSEMAIGLGMMFNFSLPVNFNSPYKATSVIDFWRRWHITLSTFLKNYLYIPLGGNRNGEFNRMRNLMITMILGGLWHGAGWTFVIWGGLHGAYLAVNHMWRKQKIRLPNYLAWTLTFFCVVIAWVFFRANTVSDALSIIYAMVGIRGIILPQIIEQWFPSLATSGIQFGGFLFFKSREVLWLIPLLIILCACSKNSKEIFDEFKPSIRWAILIIIFLSISLLNLNKASEFLYFQF